MDAAEAAEAEEEAEEAEKEVVLRCGWRTQPTKPYACCARCGSNPNPNPSQTIRLMRQVRL